MDIIIFPILFIIVLFVFWLTSSILKILKAKHGDMFENMGKPALITNNTPGTMMSFQKFVMLRRFKEIDDSSLGFKCEVLFWLQLIWVPTIIAVPFWLSQNA